MFETYYKSRDNKPNRLKEDIELPSANFKFHPERKNLSLSRNIFYLKYIISYITSQNLNSISTHFS